MVSCDLCGRALWNRGEHDLYVPLYKLLHGEVIIFGPGPGLGQPYLLVGPLCGEGRVVSWFLGTPTCCGLVRHSCPLEDEVGLLG